MREHIRPFGENEEYLRPGMRTANRTARDLWRGRGGEGLPLMLFLQETFLLVVFMEARHHREGPYAT